MDSSTFIAEFAQIANAPNGVKRLREMILDLAVRGKLVPQDPNDEPAEKLLERIKIKKEQLLKEKKIKKQKPLPPITDEDKPFDIPKGWEWVRFGHCTINRDSERKPVSRAERSNRQGAYDYYGASGVIDKIDDYLFDKDLLLIGEDGANLINRSTPIAFIASGKYWVNNHAHVIDSIEAIHLQYMRIYVNSISLLPYITGTAQPKMNQAKMNSIYVAIPPLAEQKRIVAKVDELMALCDRLEQSQQARENTRSALCTSALHQLMNAESDTDLQSAWSMVSTHFTTLANHPSAVKGLRETILQLAVRGKLVPQDPNDEPAEKLLERIKAEKEQLVKEKKIRKEKPLPPITDEDKPFEVPDTWVWCQVNDYCKDTFYGPRFSKSEYIKDGIPTIRTTDMTDKGKIQLKKPPCVSIPNEKVDLYRVLPGDLLVTRTGSIGTMAVFRGQYLALPSAYLIRLRVFHSVLPEYLYTFFNAPSGQVALGLASNVMTLANISATSIRQILSPLPPLAEQKRIVAKVDELMALCDRLEAQLTQRQQTATLLAQSATKSVVEDLSMLEGRSKQEEPILPMVEHKADDSGQLQLF